MSNKTRTDVINDVLLLIGDSTVLSSKDKSGRAKKLDRMFETAKRYVFRLQPWSCLTARVTLSADAHPPKFGYAYRHKIPGDSISITEVVDTRFKREGSYLLSDSPVMNIVYIQDTEDFSKLDSHVYSLLVSFMAYNAAIPITGKRWVMEEMKGRYADALGEALSSDSFESTPQVLNGVDDYNISKMHGTSAPLDTSFDPEFEEY